MTLAGLLVAVGVGAFAIVEDTPKAPPVPIAGRVVDADRRPVAGADVSFSLHHDGTSRGGFVTRTETDGQGRFHLEVPSAPGGGPVPGILWVYRPGALVATRSITGDTPRDWPVSMVLESSASVSLAGRVVDTTGHRVAGAKVHIRVQEHDDTGELCWNALVEIRGAYVIKTKDSGWFRTPMILDPQLKYAALVEADGYELAHTGWVAGKARTFPEVVLRPRAILDPAAVVGSVVHVDPIRRATP